MQDTHDIHNMNDIEDIRDTNNMREFTNCHRTKNGGKPKPVKVKDLSLVSEETDPQGMYTGVPEELYEEPVQDADDL